MGVEIPEAEVPEPEELRDPLSRLLAMLIVAGTLLGGIAGYLLVRASGSEGRTTVEAQRLAVRAMSTLLNKQQEAQSIFETFVTGEVQRRHAGNAFQEKFFSAEDLQRETDIERGQWETLGGQTEKLLKRVVPPLTPLTSDSEDGPRNDPIFPQRFFIRPEEEGVRLRALQDAANEEASGWGGSVASYTANLTLIAVAVYLFGLALTLPIATKRLFAGVGVGLLTAAFAWGTGTAVFHPRRAPPEAAAEYARGFTTLRTATGPQDYTNAIAHFSKAIELRPSFALAYRARADAAYTAGSPQGSGAFISITAPEALERATRDLVEARDRGLDTFDVLGSLGFYRFVFGLQRREPALFEASVDTTREAVDRNELDPIVRYNLGAALLALGKKEEARAAYRDALERTLFTDLANKKRRQDFSYINSAVGGAVTDLELISAAYPKLRRDVQSMKEFIIGSAALERIGPPPPGATRASGMRVNVFPAHAQVSGLQLENFDPEKDRVSVLWYFDSRGLGWSVIPEISGVHNLSVDQDGYYDLQEYLSTSFPASCLPDGKYRVELYVNGRLITTGTGSGSSGARAIDFREMDVAACRPADWTRVPFPIPGLTEGIASQDGSRGLYVFRLNLPNNEDLQGVMTAVVDAFGPDLFHQSPAFNEKVDYFMGLDEETAGWYRYSGGWVLAGAGVDPDGGIIVATVFGPDDYFKSEGYSPIVWESLTTLRQQAA